MARKADLVKTLNVSVVGIAGTEKERGQSGVGKSCLCNRFIKSLADDYHVEHISVLSQTDFSGRVINNDHFLYWGEASRSSDDGVEYHFHVLEQTEFIDDASFQPFKAGGKMEPYVKRCAATKLSSAEKLMYICKNQLGIEKEYEQKLMPDGKFNVDGFICVFDVSMVPSRPIERQLDYTATILTNLVKAKKPIVLATTKNDEAFDGFIREAEKLISRKEFKGSVVMVETSAHENVNVDLAFLVLAQMVDKAKNRMRIMPFAEAARSRKEILDVVTEAYQRLIRCQVTDFRALWSTTSKRLAPNQDFIHYVDLFGHEDAQRLFRRHVKKLKDDHLARKIKGYMDTLPSVLMELFPDLASLEEGDWEVIKEKMHSHHDFSRYFLECSEDGMSWAETDLLDTAERRIPFDVLDTSEAEMVFRNHINTLQKEQNLIEYRHQFKALLEETGYVTPGKTLAEVQVLFMGRECFEALSESDCQLIYDHHQRDITDKARKNFQELMLENAHLFYQFKSIAPSGTVTQDDIREITEELQEDSRFKALDRLDNERRLLLLQYLGFVHCPVREHCPAHPSCIDTVVEHHLSTKSHRPSSWNRSSNWALDNSLASSGPNNLSVIVLGINGLGQELAGVIRSLCDDDEFHMDNQVYTLDHRIIDGDVSLPHNAFRTANFNPQGCFCVFSNSDSFEFIRDSLEKTLLSNLEQEDRLPFQGLPIVIVMALEPGLSDREFEHLKGEGLSLAENLQCPFIEMSRAEQKTSKSSSSEIDKQASLERASPSTNGDSPQSDGARFSGHLVHSALQTLMSIIRQRAGLLNACHSSLSGAHDQQCLPDIRIVLAMLCGDPFSVDVVLGPLLSHQCCFLSSERSLILETFLGDSKRRVEVVATSYHSADSFRNDLVHGFILVYSTKRKASLATLMAFSQNIPNLPILIMAVTESGGAANAFFNSELSHQLITAGNATADQLHAHFMTIAASTNPKSAVYAPFFKDVWDKRVEIEQAFHLNDSGEGTLERPDRCMAPTLPLRHNGDSPYGGGYGRRANRTESNEGSGSEIYERLPTDGSLCDDGEDAVSPTYPDERRLTPSDDSDLYSTLDRPGEIRNYHMVDRNSGENLVKPSHLRSHQNSSHGRTNYYASPVTHYQSAPGQGPMGGPMATLPCHAPAFGYYGDSQDSATSPKMYSRDGGPYAPVHPPMGRFGGGHHPKLPPSGPSYPPPPPLPKTAPPSRLSRFQSLGSAEPAALWNEARAKNSTEDKSNAGGGFQVFPPPSTPPEPAPPDLEPDCGASSGLKTLAAAGASRPRWQLQHGTAISSSLPTASSSHTSLDEAAWWLDDSVFLRRNHVKEEAWAPPSADSPETREGYKHRAFTTGRRKVPEQQPHHQPMSSHTQNRKHLLQPVPPHHPGKINPKDFLNVADAIARMNLLPGAKEGPTVPPPPPPRQGKTKADYGHVLRHYGSYDADYSYTSSQEPMSGQTSAGSKGRSRHRREKERPVAYTDSDSSGSSAERRAAGMGYSGDGTNRSARKVPSHKRTRRKRAAIPVAPPRVPTLPAGLVKKPQASAIPLSLSGQMRGQSEDLSPAVDKGACSRDAVYGGLPDGEAHLESTLKEHELDSALIGYGCRLKDSEAVGPERGDRDPSAQRRKDKSRAKDEEKQEKRRLKEEERQRREREKEKERERKRNLKSSKDGKKEKPVPTLEDVILAEGRSIPLFLEKCIKFIEEEGLDSEGIYRVPGNRAHVDILFQKIEEDPNYDIRELDIAVNAVATALKDFFKRYPSILTQDQMDEMEEISMTPDRSCRLLALRDLLTKKLSPTSFNVLKFIFQHFVKVTENCKANNMDSKNLAICWWPTLLPYEFTDMVRFEMMRPHLEDTVQAMIDQFPFLFLGKDEVVMV